MRPRPVFLLGLLLGACAPAANDTTPADDTTPDFAEGSITEMAFLGDYDCDGGIAPLVRFTQESGANNFSAFLDDRLFAAGSWRWESDTLHIETPAGSYTFGTVEAGVGTLVLGEGDAQWRCRYRATEP